MRKLIKSPDLVRNTADGDIDILRWITYPCYQFLFGRPADNNKKKDIEVAYIEVIHNTDTALNFNIYLDREELKFWVDGLTELFIYEDKK